MTGPSDPYMAMLRGDISCEDYVAIVKQEVREKLYTEPRTMQEAGYRMRAAMSNLGEDVVAPFKRFFTRGGS